MVWYNYLVDYTRRHAANNRSLREITRDYFTHYGVRTNSDAGHYLYAAPDPSVIAQHFLNPTLLCAFIGLSSLSWRCMSVRMREP